MDESWYQNRDKRTDACTQVTSDYKRATVQVYVTEPINKYRVQLMTFFSLIMLAKWCRSIVFTAPAAKSLLSEGESFAEYLQTQVKAIDPYCQFTTLQTITGVVRLYVGQATNSEKENYVSINGAGWASVCSFNQNSSLQIEATSLDVIGTCFAACLGNAALFRYLTGQAEKPYTKWYCLRNNEISDVHPISSLPEELTTFLDLGRIHLIGCGAIGSSFAFLLPYLPLKTRVLLVDPDHVKDHNTSSSLMFTYKDAKDKKDKVIVCDHYLKERGIESFPFSYDYGKHEYTYDGTTMNSPDIVLCFANENNIWSTIQHQYPPICFHATTSKSWGVHVGRHIPLKENCLMCTFKDILNTKFTTECAAVTLNDPAGVEQEDISHTAILPFLAPAAALIALSEIVKMTVSQRVKENTTIFNMGTADGQFIKDYEPFGRCFICSNQDKMYPEFGKFSKFWPLSEKQIR